MKNISATAMNGEMTTSVSSSSSVSSEAPDLLDLDEIDEKPVPVTILTGFLGSGKSTLIQHLLHSEEHQKKLAIIENEFGTGLEVESMILKDDSSSKSQSTRNNNNNNINNNDTTNNKSGKKLVDVVELPNGCICCTVKDNFIQVLEAMLLRAATIDHIIIECSGMANPGPIASVFWLDNELGSRLQLNGLVCIVDSIHFMKQLKECSAEVEQQVAYADRIIVNKVDDSATNGSTSLQEVLDTVRSINASSALCMTNYSVVDVDWILEANIFGANQGNMIAKNNYGSDNPVVEDHITATGKEIIEFCRPCVSPTARPSSLIPDNLNHQHAHTRSVATLSFDYPGSMYLNKLHHWLAQILWPHQDDDNDTHDNREYMQIFRMKGILSVLKEEVEEVEESVTLDHRRFILQAVNDLWDIHPAGDTILWSENEERRCKIVVIGRWLDRDALDKEILNCLTKT